MVSFGKLLPRVRHIRFYQRTGTKTEFHNIPYRSGRHAIRSFVANGFTVPDGRYYLPDGGYTKKTACFLYHIKGRDTIRGSGALRSSSRRPETSCSTSAMRSYGTWRNGFLVSSRNGGGFLRKAQTNLLPSGRTLVSWSLSQRSTISPINTGKEQLTRMCLMRIEKTPLPVV